MAAYPEGAPCWADAMVDDLEAGKRFYGELFGWTFESSGPDYGNYTNAMHDGKHVAAIVPKMEAGMPSVWSVYFSTPDAAATGAKIADAGGQVVMGPMEVAPFGTMLVASDPGGAVFGVWQPARHAGFEKKGEPGSFCWTELHTRDTKAVDPFYEAVFGFRAKQIGDEGSGFEYKVWSLPGGGDQNDIAGRMRMTEDFPPDVPPNFLVYFAVADCDATVATATRLGAEVRMGPETTPFGRIAVLTDDQGATFGAIDLATTEGERPG
jgi:predicted enzyme related to lactoylglutathione lyase